MKEFNLISGHKVLKDKRKRDYIFSLKRYVETLLGKDPEVQHRSLSVSLQFVLGSLFYPKELQEYYESAEIKGYIQRIHDTLYYFSAKNM